MLSNDTELNDCDHVVGMRWPPGCDGQNFFQVFLMSKMRILRNNSGAVCPWVPRLWWHIFFLFDTTYWEMREQSKAQVWRVTKVIGVGQWISMRKCV